MEQQPLLLTKLHIPPVRPELVSRPRLLEKLDAGLHRSLTLVSAPAGFGKTTLLSEWAHLVGAHGHALVAAPPQIAWISLDESDNELARVLACIFALPARVTPK
jgi:LuxR family maltose regulon positive regulatory protein